MFQIRLNEDRQGRQIFDPNPYIKLRKFNIGFGGIANLGNFLKVLLNSKEQKIKMVKFKDVNGVLNE